MNFPHEQIIFVVGINHIYKSTNEEEKENEHKAISSLFQILLSVQQLIILLEANNFFVFVFFVEETNNINWYFEKIKLL